MQKLKNKNVGPVRFELTTDGSLRIADLSATLLNALQRSNGSSSLFPVGKNSVDPLFIIYPLEPIALPG